MLRRIILVGISIFHSLLIAGASNLLAQSPTKLVVVILPTAPPTAGTDITFTVQSQTATGALANVSAATGVSLSLKTGTGTIGGSLTGTIAAGTNQLTITGVTYTKAESGVVITATRTSGDSLTAGDSAPFTVAPGAATKLVFGFQPRNSTAGATINLPAVLLTVIVQDNFGNTVTSSTASITAAIGTNPGGGTLSGTTPKTASSGVASFNDLSINKAGTGYTLTAAATGLTNATSNAFNISAGTATKLAFTTQPSSTTIGSSISPPPTATVQDTLGNTVTSSSASVTIAIGTNPSGGTLGGTTTVNASSGVATFTGLNINQAGNGYTLAASSTGLTGATSNSFNITSGSSGGTIAGVITRVSNGASITGALVEAFQGPTLKGSAGTNSSGNYSITGLAAGTYTVRTSFTGLVPQMLNNVTVASGNTTPVNLSLNFGIAIYFPTAGSVINDYSVLVEGEFDTALAAEVGISVNGVPARVDMETFSVLVAVSPQTTSITAILADKNGSTLASHTIPVTVQASAPALTLQPRPTEGIAPLTVSFDLTSLVPISQVSLDTNGDGTVDFQGSTLAGQTFIYQQPGLYYPAVTVTNNSGVTYSAVALIQVYDATSLDSLIQQKWQGFKNALRAGNTAAALLFIAQDERAEFQGLFQNLTVPLSAIDQVLTNIQFVRARGNTVEYEMLRTDSRGQLSYIVRFVLDKDGVWRIQDL